MILSAVKDNVTILQDNLQSMLFRFAPFEDDLAAYGISRLRIPSVGSILPVLS